MYQTIYKLTAVKENDEIASYLYTDIETARRDAKKMADNRRENMLKPYSTQEISHYDQATTTVYHFDDGLKIEVYQTGWAMDLKGQIRCFLGTDYTGKGIVRDFASELHFYNYIKLSQPVFFN